MLVLSRKVGERVLAGDTWVKVISVQGNQVKLGFEAPPDVPIWREEIAHMAGEPPPEANK